MDQEREAGLKTQREAGSRQNQDRERLDQDRERLDSRQREVGLKTCRSLFHKVVVSAMRLYLHHYYCVQITTS